MHRTELVHEVVGRSAVSAPGRTAVVSVDDGDALTFAELAARVRAVAAWLEQRTRPGDRVAVVADNAVGYLELYYAVPAAGRVLTLVNQRLSPREQLAQIEAADPALLVGDARHLDELPRPGVAFGSAQWREATVPPAGPKAPAAEPRPDDPAWLLFTSGSTGAPKGVVHTHGSISAGVWGSVEGRAVTTGVYLFPFPMCHVAGYNLLVHHAVASTVVLMAQFRAPAFVDAVNAHGVTSCSLAPTMLHALVAHVEETGVAMPTLRSVAYGSAAIAPGLIRRAADLLAVEFHQGYGMTETAGNVTFLGPGDHRAALDGDAALLRSAGRPHSGVQLRIVDDEARDVPPGDTGEIVVRGGQVMAGYWHDDRATSEALAGGWLRTGDIGRLGDDGRLTVVDRRKDVIITGGENVSSREVEDAVTSHPDVDAAAVVGVPDDYWGEAICAVVVPRPGRTPTADELVAHVRGLISPFKRPRHVVFAEALPLTSNGKVAKDVVRRLARDAVGQPAEDATSA